MFGASTRRVCLGARDSAKIVGFSRQQLELQLRTTTAEHMAQKNKVDFLPYGASAPMKSGLHEKAVMQFFVSRSAFGAETGIAQWLECLRCGRCSHCAIPVSHQMRFSTRKTALQLFRVTLISSGLKLNKSESRLYFSAPHLPLWLFAIEAQAVVAKTQRIAVTRGLCDKPALCWQQTSLH